MILGVSLELTVVMNNSFHPSPTPEQNDPLSRKLSHIAATILAILFGLSPFLFIPTLYISSGASKAFILLSGIALAVFFITLSFLREGKLSLRLPLGILGFWVIAGVTALAAFFSVDRQDALFGNSFESYTAAFVGLMALVATTAWFLGSKKQSAIRLYAILILSAFVLSAFHIVRLFFGADTLSFGFFDSSTSSPIGSWNGLAVFYGLIIILSLTALLQLSLTGLGRFIVMVSTALSLFMLAVVNFTTIWYILFGISVLILIYALVKNRWLAEASGNHNEGVDQLSVILLTSLVALVSIVFVIGGARIGPMIAEPLGVTFVEVRPSFVATIDLAQATFSENAFFGAGPNRFADVWRMHKDPNINQTIFWNSDFDTGFSYLMTFVIGTGLFGLVAWSLFFILWIWAAFRFLFSSSALDQFWYFIGLSSLIASAYLWVICLVYVPPPSILILAALTTGVFFSITTKLNTGKGFVLSVARHRAHGFVLIVLAVMTVSALGSVVFIAGKQVLAVYEFNSAVSAMQPGDSIAKLEEGVGKAFTTYDNDIFASQLAYYQLLYMRSLLQSENPSAEDQQAFQDAAAKAVNAARLAVERDPTDPRNHQLLGQIYSVLSLVGVEGAKDSAIESYQMVKKYDPHNPVPYLLEADLAVQNKDQAKARASAEEAVRIRPAYTEALYFLAQLDVAEGNVPQAITHTVGMVQLDPQNAAYRYQLGVLFASNKQLDEAIAALEQAVTLDAQYANARYLLALGYAEKGRTDDAIAQLKMVRELNDSNNVVDDIIKRLESGEKFSITDQETVDERDPEDGGVVAEDLEGGLVTSPNPVQGAESNDTAQ